MPSHVTFREIVGFRLVTAEPSRLTTFYRAIGFVVGEAVPIPTADMDVLGLKGGGFRIPMSLGQSHVDLECFDHPGRAYPLASTAYDLVFQHFALVTDDIEAASLRVLGAGATPISRDGPVKLPLVSGGVTAFKFRDPEGHPLELLEFPEGSDRDWRNSGLMGIDHSAIAVSDVAVSRAFYIDHGLHPAGATINTGVAQDALDGLDFVEVHVVPMTAAEGASHLELLAYRRPAGRKAGATAANAIAATRIIWRADEDALIRDPDGHLHQLSRQDR